MIPASWYPDTTPAAVQRWTAPSCSRCNREFGKVEKDLLVRLIPCLDPKSEATAGLVSKVMRSMGLDTDGLSERDQLHREALRRKITAEMLPMEDLAGKPGKIPGLGPPDGVDSKWALPIPYAAFSMTAEKIARGCEWKLRSRYVETPYAIHTFTRPNEIVYPESWQRFVERLDFGPGCRIQRFAIEDEDRNSVRYSITIWNALNLEAIIDKESELKKDEENYRRPEGLDLTERPAMRVSPYLRYYED